MTATPFSPAICSNCGKASYVSQWSVLAFNLLGEALIPVVILFAIIVRSVYGLLVYPAGIFVTTFVLARVFPLIAASDSMMVARREAARRTRGFVVIASLAFAAFVLHRQYGG